MVRGSFGIFYDRIPTRATSNALQRDGSKYIMAILGPTAAGAPVFPNILAAQPSVLVTKPSITRIDPNIENNSSHQANIQLERELPYETSVSVGYIYLRGIHIILSRNVNVPRCTAAVDANLCRPDPNFGNIWQFEGSGNSEYNGLVFSLNKRQGKWASARVSYTFSKAVDDSGNFFFSTPQDNFDRAAEWGRSDNDQRHRLTLNGTFKLPAAGKGSCLSGSTAISSWDGYSHTLRACRSISSRAATVTGILPTTTGRRESGEIRAAGLIMHRSICA